MIAHSMTFMPIIIVLQINTYLNTIRYTLECIRALICGRPGLSELNHTYTPFTLIDIKFFTYFICVSFFPILLCPQLTRDFARSFKWFLFSYKIRFLTLFYLSYTKQIQKDKIYVFLSIKFFLSAVTNDNYVKNVSFQRCAFKNVVEFMKIWLN